MRRISSSLLSRLIIFQFQKVRLWGTHNRHTQQGHTTFQFQKVRLWAHTRTHAHARRSYFNSKRCDYELLTKYVFSLARQFQFQKVRLWAVRERMLNLFDATFQFQKVRLWVFLVNNLCLVLWHFNSKRCDYELMRLNNAVAVFVISIPKGAIMSQTGFTWHWKLRAYFNSKRCDYEL